jgi:Ca-activated chloride channel family protein
MRTFGIHWGDPGQIIYIFLVILAALIVVYRLHKVRKVIALLGKQVGGISFLKYASMPRVLIRSVVWLIGYTFLFITLLRPQWDKKDEIVAQEGRDLFIALDISRSMLATDMQPDRLSLAKEKIKALVKGLSSERVGLILFSGSAFISCPLTVDYNAFFMFLDQVDRDTISSGSTSIAHAVNTALQRFESTPDRKNKLLVIFTDGEDFSGNLSAVKEHAREQGLTIFTVGIGTQEGAPIPLYDRHGKQSGHQRDRKGSVVISRLDEVLLADLAKQLGGTYVHATQDNNDIDSIIERVNRFEKEKFEDRTIACYQEQYPYFLFVSFICFLIEWLL